MASHQAAAGVRPAKGKRKRQDATVDGSADGPTAEGLLASPRFNLRLIVSLSEIQAEVVLAEVKALRSDAISAPSLAETSESSLVYFLLVGEVIGALSTILLKSGVSSFMFQRLDNNLSPFSIQPTKLRHGEKEAQRAYIHKYRCDSAVTGKSAGAIPEILTEADHNRMLFIATFVDDAIMEGATTAELSVSGCFLGREDGAVGAKKDSFLCTLATFENDYCKEMAPDSPDIAKFRTFLQNLCFLIMQNRKQGDLPVADINTWRLGHFKATPFIYLMMLWDPLQCCIRTYIGQASSAVRFRPGTLATNDSHIVAAARTFNNTGDIASLSALGDKLDDFLIASSYVFNLRNKTLAGESSRAYPMSVLRA
eukprot:c18039_g1_i5.p1 GENE.c18039_g1_i5~~c18039_g1_i5.p1  ORF type:complete len:368 (+),score=30.67 c18039_g1_i5:58-1161(+)